MSKMTSEQIYKSLLTDIKKTISELYVKGLVRDEQGIVARQTGNDSYEISFSGKTDANHVLFDKHASISYVMNALLKERQYTILLYDKSIVQAEFCVNGNEISKERLVFIKKYNRRISREEIAIADAADDDWFAEEEGIPLYLRIDYDPSSHVEYDHPTAHLTLSNIETCRIPIQDAVTFSEFIRFVLLHFYDDRLNVKQFRLAKECSITSNERKMMHIGWI